MMGHLHNRNIIIGVTGGIAAYKAAELIRLFKREGAAVRVIMSRGAQSFITPLTLQALSGLPVHTDLLDETAEMGMGHIALARWADALLVAPATADILARLAQGRADDLLTTTVLATPAPVFVAPAMNQQMWHNPATSANVNVLEQRGVVILGPDEGEQACGDQGAGRMLQPQDICVQVNDFFPNQALAGRRVVVTAGPTVEPIDPVRFISNRSSGKMGFAMAQAAAEAGAEVVLISGPVNLATPPGIERINVTTAAEMLECSLNAIALATDIFIASAAVADYRVDQVAAEKIKKSSEPPRLTLVANPDIIATVARHNQRPRVVVGFAAETERLEEHARAKLTKKSLDAVIANNVAETGIGFDSDLNAVTWVAASGDDALPIATKLNLARELIDRCARVLQRTGA